MDQMSEGNLILWDGAQSYDGSENDDFFGTGSGIILFDPASGLGSVTEATGRATGPFLPTTFSAGPFLVEQFTFADDGRPYVIYQWTITNISGAPVPAKLLFATDWDLGLMSGNSSDELTGWDDARRLAFPQDSPAAGDSYNTGGVALISGVLDNYRLGFCCELTDLAFPIEDYFERRNDGNQDDDTDNDKEVGVSADLGELAPGASACVAFVQAVVADDVSAASGLAKLKDEIDAARALYETIPDGFRCAAGLNNFSRGTSTEKGSVVHFAKVDIRWDDAGFLLQDTFLSLTNDYPQDVQVQLYLVNGDPPLDADPATGERAHPGWNWVDNGLTLTGDQPTYWSALSGQPAAGGLSPFTALDPGFPPGRPDPAGGRMLRGYVIGFAVNAASNPISWNHLKGEGTIVDYAGGASWEYGTWNFASGMERGTVLSGSGTLSVDVPSMLLMNFQAVGSGVFSGPRQVISDTDLTLVPCDADLRQETEGPVTTKANFNVWNMNEVKFSGAHPCVTCWDQTVPSQYDPPNHFLLQNLQTDHGKARIDGLASQVCNVDFDPGDGLPLGDDPRDVVSEATALLGVVARMLTIDGGVDRAAAGTNLVGMGSATCFISYDRSPPPPEATMPRTPAELIDWLERELHGVQEGD
ncbi:MAG: hypothetical protein GY715_19360 [Planctomycetes bacterium]|nr:hypothetical protein [Planctomycetota bacterium]